MELSQEKAEYWRDEVISFLALASIKGVGYKTLYKIALSNTCFKNILKTFSISDLSKILRVSFSDSISLEDLRVSLWKTGLSEARALKNKILDSYFVIKRSSLKN